MSRIDPQAQHTVFLGVYLGVSVRNIIDKHVELQYVTAVIRLRQMLHKKQALTIIYCRCLFCFRETVAL